MGHDLGQWYKGSLHAHSDVKEMYWGSSYHPQDKARKPEEVLADYASCGYHFVMLAEQNGYTTQDDIDDIPDRHGVTVIPEAEFDQELVKTGQHLSHVNPSDGASHHVTQKSSLANIIRRAAKDPKNPLVVQLHPQFPREGDGRQKDILGSSGVDALEIVNSWWMERPGAFEDSSGRYSPFAFHLWDRMLTDGEEVWGVAGCCSVQPGDVNKSWIRVWSDKTDPTPDDLVSAIGAGKFYVSAVSVPTGTNPPNGAPPIRDNAPGVAITKIETNGTGVTIETDAARVHAIVNGSPRLTVDPVPGSTGTFTTFCFPDVTHFPHGTYIRFECVGADDRWDESYSWNNTQKLNRSWTQPLRIV